MHIDYACDCMNILMHFIGTLRRFKAICQKLKIEMSGHKALKLFLDIYGPLLKHITDCNLSCILRSLYSVFVNLSFFPVKDDVASC